MNILSIGGSDPSSGAGIQSDIKAFHALGAFGMTVVTAITSQNTSKFRKTEPVSGHMVGEQIMSVMSDFKIDGIKIGMAYNAEIMKIIHQKLNKVKVPIVVDPVIRSTTGGSLMRKSDMECFREHIVPLATAITPNQFEAKLLSGMKDDTDDIYKKMAVEIQRRGAANVIITGIEDRKNNVFDFVLEENKEYKISSKKANSTNHGSGCNHSAALIVSLAGKKSILESAKFSKAFTSKAISNSKKIGKGIKITDVISGDQTNERLSSAINMFLELKRAFKHIPECQTNFVYSKPNPESTKDILGISGRIVKTGKTSTVAGELRYGGSKHVAAALLVVNKKFPEIRSAINIKYQKETISKLKSKKFTVSRYDRKNEPTEIKTKGSTVSWGTNDAIKKLKNPPDVVFHEGDFGKEPMILIFGEEPRRVLEKIQKII